VKTNVQEFIEHHGVKGMKWGVRRSSRARKKGTERTKYSKSPKSLTQDELEKRIKRMGMEKEYNKLNKRDVSTGERLASEMMTSIGKTTIVTVGTGAAIYGAKKIIEKKSPDLARAAAFRKK